MGVCMCGGESERGPPCGCAAYMWICGIVCVVAMVVKADFVSGFVSSSVLTIVNDVGHRKAIHLCAADVDSPIFRLHSALLVYEGPLLMRARLIGEYQLTLVAELILSHLLFDLVWKQVYHSLSSSWVRANLCSIGHSWDDRIVPNNGLLVRPNVRYRWRIPVQ